MMFIHREDFYYTEDEGPALPWASLPPQPAEIVLAKQRNGPTGSIHLRFRDSLVRFETIIGGPQ